MFYIQNNYSQTQNKNSLNTKFIAKFQHFIKLNELLLKIAKSWIINY